MNANISRVNMRFIDHPDQDLNAQAFRKEGGRLTRVYGKSDPPPPPDYGAAAQATAEGNIEAAKYATNANRINQYSPYGSLTYEYAPQYDSEGKETGAGWTQKTNLTPQAQAALDQQLSLNQKYGEVANIGFDKARTIFENPELDMSALPQRGINVGQSAQDAILSRLNPQLQSQEEALRTRLANQGITLGSTAYNREMDLQGQRANDLTMQAALQGINLDQANRASALQEQAYIQDRPLNLINALRTGNQVQAPQFQQAPQQQQTQGADILGATTQQYGDEIGVTNAKNANSASMTSGLMSAAAIGAMMF